MRKVLVVSLTATLIASCGSKKAPEDAIIEGWQGDEAWSGQCYHAKAWATLGPGDRRMHRVEVMNAIMEQWRGERDDGISFDSGKITDLETTMLGDPDRIEAISAANLGHCRDYFSGKDTGAWAAWFGSANKTITADDCKSAPLRDTIFEYLDIGKGWQFNWGVCKGDRVAVLGTSMDYYKVRGSGPWINVDGDADVVTTTPEFPCNTEGCLEGMLVLRFKDYDGFETVTPVGHEGVFVAPSHGSISVQINDHDWSDNKYKQEGSIIHHTGITYKPAD